MPLKDLTLFGEIDKVKLSIERLKEFEPPDGYYLAFSGGTTVGVPNLGPQEISDAAQKFTALIR